MDVALTADRQPVLMHDATVDRTTDGHGRLASLTLAEVRALDAGSWFDPEFAGTQVPTFAEFLDVLAASGHRAIVELKGAWDAAAVAAADRRGDRAQTSSAASRSSSFDARTLAVAGGRVGGVPRLLILKHVPADVVRAATRGGACAASSSTARRVLDRPEMVDESTRPASASSSTRSTATRSGMRSPRSASTVS